MKIKTVLSTRTWFLGSRHYSEGVDVHATESKVAEYKREHAGEIALINQRQADEDRVRAAAEAGPPDTTGTWAPRRMSNDSHEDDVSRGMSYTPGIPSAGVSGDLVPRMPVQPLPVSTGRSALGVDWEDQTAEGRAKRQAAVAAASGIDVDAVARQRCMQEAFMSIW